MSIRKTNTFRRAFTFGAVAGVMLVASTVSSQSGEHQNNQAEMNSSMSMKEDLANRSPDIHWPEGFDPTKADLFAHNELIINASCERVWRHISEAAKWPEWYPNSKDVRILSDGEKVLKEGTAFRWTTFGLQIESKVHEFVPYSRLGWYGYAPGAEPTFYHTWYLVPKGDACRVVMDEAGIGSDAAHLRETDEGLMHRGHDLWLATLKWISEGK